MSQRHDRDFPLSWDRLWFPTCIDHIGAFPFHGFSPAQYPSEDEHLNSFLPRMMLPRDRRSLCTQQPSPGDDRGHSQFPHGGDRACEKLNWGSHGLFCREKHCSCIKVHMSPILNIQRTSPPAVVEPRTPTIRAPQRSSPKLVFPNKGN